MKTKTGWSYIWHFVPWVFSMCVGTPTELLALHTWKRFSDHKIFLLFQGEGKKINLAEIFKVLNLSSRFPSSAVSQVSVILRCQWLHMKLWSMFASREAVLRLGFLSDWESQPCSGVFSLSKVAGEQGWMACSGEWACELHSPRSSILAPLKSADGCWPSSKWNTPLVFFCLAAPKNLNLDWYTVSYWVKADTQSITL